MDFAECLTSLFENRITQLNTYDYRRLLSENEKTQLFEALAANQSLKELSLWGCSLKDASESGWFADVLGDNKQLTMLDLSTNSLNQHGAKCLGESLMTNITLQELTLHVNFIESEDIWDCHIGNKGVAFIADALKVNKTLENLVLTSNGITAPGALDLGKALEGNTTLSQLILDNNYLKESGVKFICDGLKRNDTLYSLSLANCSVDDEASLIIANMLKCNQTLAVLVLDDNSHIGNQGIKYLAESLRRNFGLNTLDLSYTSTDDKSTIADLVAAIEENENLCWLYINIAIGSLKNRILRKLAANKQLKEKIFSGTLAGEEKAAWNRSRIMFVGQGKAGKSATVRSMLGKRFVSNWNSTIGASVSETTTTKNSAWQETVAVTKYASEFAARIMVDNLKERNRRKVNNRKGVDSNEVLVPLSVGSANKETLTNTGSVSPVKSDFNNVENFEEKLIISAKRRENAIALSLWDFGGQKVFYSMHHLFLTESGVYILVFDIRDLLQKDSKPSTLEYMLFWLKSIRLHAIGAPLILVGTFCGQIQNKESLLLANTILKELVHTDFPQILSSSDSLYFAIDNKESIGIRELRCFIENIVRNDESVQTEVSIRWLVLLDKILAHRNKEPYITLSSVQTIADEIGIKSMSELEYALSQFHQRGFLIHLTGTETLRNMIILKPQWLVDSLGKVIRDGTVHRFDPKEFEKVGLTEDLHRTFEEALTTRDWLEHVWEKEQVDFLIDLMKRTMLMSAWGFNNEDYYLVPSLLHNSYPDEKISGLQCIFDFSSSFLPIGVFQRLVCLCIAGSSKNRSNNFTQKAQIMRPELYNDYAVFELDPGLVISLRENVKSQTIILRSADNLHGAKAYNVVYAMLRKVNAEVMGSGLIYKILFENSDTDPYSFVSHNEAQKMKLSPWFDDTGSKPVPQKNPNVDTSVNIELNTFLDNL